MEMLALIEPFLKYIGVPVAGFVWLIYLRQQNHDVEIAVLKSVRESDKSALDRELSGIRESTSKISLQLKSIEEFLRK